MMQKANAAVDIPVHRPFCKCVPKPVDGFPEEEMLGQSADVSLSFWNSFLWLSLLSFWLLLLGFFPCLLRSVRNTGYLGWLCKRSPPATHPLDTGTPGFHPVSFIPHPLLPISFLPWVSCFHTNLYVIYMYIYKYEYTRTRFPTLIYILCILYTCI